VAEKRASVRNAVLAIKHASSSWWTRGCKTSGGRDVGKPGRHSSFTPPQLHVVVEVTKAKVNKL